MVGVITPDLQEETEAQRLTQAEATWWCQAWVWVWAGWVHSSCPVAVLAACGPVDFLLHLPCAGTCPSRCFVS